MSKTQAEALKEIIVQDYEEKLPGTALNKCIKFCNEMQVGDLVMIVDKSRITFATVGEFFEADNPEYTAEYENDIHNRIKETIKSDETVYECPYIKRRQISIIKEIREEYFSPYLYKAIAVNRHSLSEVNDYASIILSSCFESYIYKDRLVLAFRVNKQDDINAIALSDFIAGAAKLVSNNIQQETNNIVVKTALHSPGDIILEVTNYISSHGFLVILLYVAIFGGKAGNYELNSIISCIKNAINYKYEKEKQALELRKTKAECDLLEQQVIEKQLENARREAELVNSIETIVPQVANSAKTLEIELSDAKIVDISSFIEKYK
jgi:hypothetical protein